MRLRPPTSVALKAQFTLLVGCATDAATGPNQPTDRARPIQPSLATTTLRGGCPSEFDFTSVDEMMMEEGQESPDRNGNGVACELMKKDGSNVAVDDNYKG